MEKIRLLGLLQTGLFYMVFFGGVCYARNCGFLNACFFKFSLVKFQVSSQIKTGRHSLKTTPAGGETNWHRNKQPRSTFLCSHCGNVQLAKDSTIHLSAFMQRSSSPRDHSRLFVHL